MTDVAADEDVEEEFEGDEEGGGGEAGKKAPSRFALLSGKMRYAVIGVVALLFVGGTGAGVFYAGLLDGMLGVEDAEPEIYQPVNVTFYDLPEMIVNLVSNTKKPAYLKIHMSLELDEDQDLITLERLMPRVIDHFQVFLRELRVDDLSGSAGIYRIKEELLRRVSVAVYPVEVRAVLFKEMLIQ